LGMEFVCSGALEGPRFPVHHIVTAHRENAALRARR
jgi:hypothetical protein